MVYSDNLALDPSINTGGDANSRRVALLGRMRLQLPLALLFGVVIPGLARGRWENFADQVASYDNSLLGTLAAMLLGFLIYRKVTALPGANALTNILPAFVTSYASIMVVFLALRLDYSRTQFLLSFVLVTALFYVLTFAVARARRPAFAIVPGGRSDVLKQAPGVSWREVGSPAAAEAHSRLPLVADLRHGGLTEEWERYIAETAISGRRVFNAKQLQESLEGRVQIEHLSENEFGHLAPDSLYAPAKRYIDALTALVALVFLFPVFVILALAIRLESRGPAIFRQQRMGYRGRPFTVYKFRSMRLRRSEADPLRADMTQSDDARITRLGRLIRKTRLDELPQIFNILCGEMSWIGPRPETLRLSSLYEQKIPFYRYRHIVRPGISGWAQVKQGHVTSVDDVRAKLEYDFYYVKHFSLWLDILIGLQTLRVMLSGHGAR